MHAIESTVTLPVVCTVGFTGHRKLPDESTSRRLISQVLGEMKSSHEVLCGVASVAVGGDLLFAESCVALEIPLRVLLPLPVDDFRNDFDESSWDRAEAILGKALSVEVTGDGGLREERYYECGLETVQQSRMLIALWDGEPARGLGGTAQIFEFARSVGRPVVCIHSRTGEIERAGPGIETVDRELEFLNRLPDGNPPLDGSPRALAQSWLTKMDANAMRVSPQVKRLAALPIILTAAAAVVTGAAQRSGSAEVWGGVGIILGVLASVVATGLRLDTRRARWIRIRTAAEVTRSMLALWTTPSRYRVLGAGVLPELAGMVRSLNFLKSEAESKTPDVGAFKAEYLQTRILDQKDYFLGQSRKAAQTARRFGMFGRICIVVAVLALVWKFAGKWLVGGGHVVTEGAWLPLTTSAIFQMATIAGALIVVHDCSRREKRYYELYRSLSVWEAELRPLETWRPVMDVVGKVEEALLVELLEWRSLFQNMKLPKN